MEVSTLITIIVAATIVGVNSEERLVLKVSKHQPCGVPGGHESIRFSDSKVSTIVPDPSRGNGCYKLAGAVKVLNPIKGRINIYVESKNGTHSDALDCKNAGPDNCGGIGSCIYCDACNALQKPSRSRIQLLSNGQQLDCNRGIDVGEYQNVVLSFCTPDLDDFLRTQNIARDAWNEVIGCHGTTVFETVYIFQDTPINTYSKSQLKDALSSGNGLIGCHKLILNLSSDKATCDNN